ncbi:(2Fe-2S)-binding protein [Arthrobacter sp. zg-Y1219]|uniref:(2Fe-2S)-binding protein n=1 Tax=Arthrobacter sp. zg-Y1219 TaxID=3049067 RepID=UPI0024C34A26|nr:2Fe-2S iron-sulfur cluster-binding protein [Arthrobacter sp. zg-Y1219]MDK1361694.1 (2Fe-2S)-binding protein [Arthrobacter sp. zg-Y1219]
MQTPQRQYPLSLVVNGEPVTAEVPATRRLVDFVREDLGLTGTKVGCEVGFCGVCSVLLDGEPVAACHMLALQVDGRQLTTVEGLSARPACTRLQEAFISEGGFQCGFCTSGQLVMGTSLLEKHDVCGMEPGDIALEMAGTACRCTGYYGIHRALRKAAQ